MFRGQEVENRPDDGLVLLVVGAGFLRGVQVFLEPGFKEAVVIDVPGLSVPGDDLAAGIEERGIFPQEGGTGLIFRRTGASGGTDGSGWSRGGVCRRRGIGHLCEEGSELQGAKRGKRGRANKGRRSAAGPRFTNAAAPKSHALRKSWTRKTPFSPTSMRKKKRCPFWMLT